MTIDTGDYLGLDGTAIARGIKQKQFSATEIMDCALTRAQALNPTLNAITWQTFEQARESAVKLDSQSLSETAAFTGVPFLFKDISAVKGLPQTCHSRLFKNEVADHDSAIVCAFRHAGLLSLGKTNTPELCLTITTESQFAGPCHNPWNLEYSTGGSSGGAAAAVAAGIVPLAHGSDGGGSIRIPASCCGLVGLKPSRGLTPVEPDLASSWSGMSVSHVLTRSVRDSAGVLDTIRLRQPALYPMPVGPDSYLQSIERPVRATIAVQDAHPTGAKVDAAVMNALTATARLLEKMGHRLEARTPPVDYGALAACTGTVIYVHTAQNVLPQLARSQATLDTPLLEEVTRRMARRGEKIAATDFIAALDGIRAAALEMAQFHNRFELLLSPVLATPPAPLGWLDMNGDIKLYAERFASYSGYCALANATGQPSISLPVVWTDDGLPVGVMLTAAWGNDALLLNLARQLEQELNWQSRRPQLSAG